MDAEKTAGTKEQRIFARKKIEAEIQGSLSIVRGFELLDISQSGALILAHENLKLDGKFFINFTVLGEESIKICSKVIRSVLVDNSNSDKADEAPSYQIGLEFIAPDKEQLKTLLSYIINTENIDKPE